MKLLMENWRRFLKESKAAQLENLLNDLGIYMEQNSLGYNIVLMELPKQESTPKIIGMIETNKSDKPCIPMTHEIGAVGVEPMYENTGVGTYLYEVAALIVHDNHKAGTGGGITSDHMASTTNPAKKVWDRLENKFNYIKRKTEPGTEEYNEDGEIVGGSDTFDYNNKTPDPNDDCDNVDQNYAKAATDHSLGIPPDRASWVRSMISVQIENYENYKSKFGEESQQNLDSEMIRSADSLFNKVYNPGKTGVYGDPTK